MTSPGTPLVVDKKHTLARRSVQSVHSVADYWAVVPLFLLDALCIVVSMTLAYQLRFNFLQYHAPFSPEFYIRLVIAAVLLWEIVFACYRLYHPEHIFSGVQEYGSVFNAVTVGLCVLVMYTFFDRRAGQDISRGWLMIVWFFSVLSVMGTRFVYRRVVYILRRRGVFVRRALIVGANQEARDVIVQLDQMDRAGIQVVGIVDSELPLDSEFEGCQVWGGLGDLGSLIRKGDVQELIVIPTAVGREALLDIYQNLGTNHDVQIRLSSGLYELFTTGVRVNEVGAVPLVTLDRTRIVGVDVLAKTILDYVLAGMGVILLSPLFLMLAILTKLDSSGPAIYRRRVVGLHGKEFDAFKFRTMITNAQAYLDADPELKREWETTGKIQDDPRITRVGRVLRRFSLDELPQLFNVLRGEMSLVGPRMITPKEQKHFGRWRHNRLTVKPGLTGLWQISGRSDLPYEERVRLDMYYIRNHSIWLDIKVIVGTVSAVLFGRGAY